jgi:gluconolactonase
MKWASAHFFCHMKKIIGTLSLLTLGLTAMAQYPTIGKIHRYDAALDALLDTTAKIEILANGFTWSEGPVWVKKEGYLLFTDVPENTIHKWSEAKGLEVFLKPSGYTGTGVYSEEPGANGLIINSKGNLVSCEHGDRRIAEMPIHHPEQKKTLAHMYEGKKLNSPNDLVQKKSGDYYFTDPPYGLPGRGKPEPAKELDFQGVYRINKKGEISLQIKNLGRPNGLAFNPDESILYVGTSERPTLINAYPVDKEGNLGEGKLFFDASELAKQGIRGGYDGMKVDAKGNVWTTGPGGVLIINSSGKLLGRIATGNGNSNVAFGGADGKYLFITSDMNLLLVKIK